MEEEGESVCREWVPDQQATACFVCGAVFTWQLRRHHCRSCGQVVCGSCSTHRIRLSRSSQKTHRVCNNCLKARAVSPPSSPPTPLSSSPHSPVPILNGDGEDDDNGESEVRPRVLRFASFQGPPGRPPPHLRPNGLAHSVGGVGGVGDSPLWRVGDLLAGAEQKGGGGGDGDGEGGQEGGQDEGEEGEIEGARARNGSEQWTCIPLDDSDEGNNNGGGPNSNNNGNANHHLMNSPVPHQHPPPALPSTPSQSSLRDALRTPTQPSQPKPHAQQPQHHQQQQQQPPSQQQRSHLHHQLLLHRQPVQGFGRVHKHQSLQPTHVSSPLDGWGGGEREGGTGGRVGPGRRSDGVGGRAHPMQEQLQELMDAMASSSVDTQLRAVRQCRELLQPENKVPLEHAFGLLPRLTQLQTHSPSTELQIEACWALVGLSVVVQHEAMEALARHLKDPLSHPLALGALGAIAETSPSLHSLALSCSLTPLLARLHSPSPNQVVASVRTLSHLAASQTRPDPPTVQLIATRLCALLGEQDVVVRVEVCWALARVCDGASSASMQAVVEAGVCTRIVNILTHSPTTVRHAAILTVKTVITNSARGTTALLSAGLLHHLRALLQNPPTTLLCSQACSVLRALTCSRGAHVVNEVVQFDIVPSLLDLVADRDPQTSVLSVLVVEDIVRAGTPGHVAYLVHNDCLRGLLDVALQREDAPQLTLACLRVVDAVLNLDEAQGHARGANAAAAAGGGVFVWELAGAVAQGQLRVLCAHPNKEVAKQAKHLAGVVREACGVGGQGDGEGDDHNNSA